MNDSSQFSGPDSGRTKRKRTNGSLDGRPVPPVSIQALLDERNWTALAGLALLATGVLLAIGGLLGMSFNLWALGLAAVGGWIAASGWLRYQDAGQRWDDTSRNRAVFGGLTALVGLLGLLQFNAWSIILFGAGGWLAYDTWQRFENGGRVWTPTLRNRAIAAAVLGVIGLSSLIHVGGAGLLLIVIGVALLFGRTRRT